MTQHFLFLLFLLSFPVVEEKRRPMLITGFDRNIMKKISLSI